MTERQTQDMTAFFAKIREMLGKTTIGPKSLEFVLELVKGAYALGFEDGRVQPLRDLLAERDRKAN